MPQAPVDGARAPQAPPGEPPLARLASQHEGELKPPDRPSGDGQADLPADLPAPLAPCSAAAQDLRCRTLRRCIRRLAPAVPCLELMRELVRELVRGADLPGPITPCMPAAGMLTRRGADGRMIMKSRTLATVAVALAGIATGVTQGYRICHCLALARSIRSGTASRSR